MAYGFGSGVQAQLGATDYSNYLRGALSGAQMQAQGGAAIGAGVQNALAGIGEGIEKFQQNQQEISAMAGDVKGMTKANPYLLQSLDPKQMKVLEKLRDSKPVSKRDMLEVYGAISSQSKMQQQQAEQSSVQNLRAAQIGDLKATRNSEAIENKAITGSLASRPGEPQPTSSQAVQRYLELGGTSEVTAQRIGDLAGEGSGAKSLAAGRIAMGEAMKPNVDNPAAAYLRSMSNQGFPPDMGVVDSLRLVYTGDEKEGDGYTQVNLYADVQGNPLGRGVLNKTTGELMLAQIGGGVPVPMPEGARPTTLSQGAGMPVDQKTFMDIESNILGKKRTIDRMIQYLSDQEGTEQGFARLATAFSAHVSTLLGEGLTEEELSQQIAKGQLQGLVGAMRVSIGGTGVMTEGDVQRVMAYLGGDVSLLQNKELVEEAMKRAMADVYREFEELVPHYNYIIKNQTFGNDFNPIKPPNFPPEVKAWMIGRGVY